MLKSLATMPWQFNKCETFPTLPNGLLPAGRVSIKLEWSCITIMSSYAALVQQLRSGSPSDQHQAVAALSALPLTPQNWLSAAGAIPCLVQLLHCTSKASPRAWAIRCLLAVISDFVEGRGLEVAPDGIFSPLVALLLRHDDASFQYVAALTLSTLAMNSGNQHRIMDAGAIPPLVQLLTSSLEDLHSPAARALCFLAENCNVRPRIIEAGALRPLLHLLESSDVLVQQSAVAAFRLLATEETDPVTATTAIPLLVKLLKSSSAEVQVEAMQALGNLVSDGADTSAQVVAAGTIPLLVDLLSTSGASAEVLPRCAAKALFNLAFFAPSDIIAAGAVEPLVSLLPSASDDIQCAVSDALLILSRNEAGRARISAAGAIAPFVRFLQTPHSAYLQMRAIMTLANLALCDAKLVVKAGAVPLIVELLTWLVSQEDAALNLQNIASLALHNIASDHDTHTALLAASPLLPLVRLLSAVSEEAQEHAQQTLLQLSNHSSFPGQFVAAGAIPPLVLLLRSESASVQQRAMRMLCLLAANVRPDIFESVKNAGALPLLARLQTDSSSEAMRLSAEKLLQALTSGTPLFDGQEKHSPFVLSSAAASSVHPHSAAGSSATAASVLPHTATSALQQQLPPRPKKSCWSCGVMGEPLKKCSLCTVAAYCGAGCQKADWKVHKGQCAGLRAGAASTRVMEP